MFSCNLCSFTFLFTSSLRVFLLDIPVRLVMGFEVLLVICHFIFHTISLPSSHTISLPSSHNLASHFTQSHFLLHTLHNLTSHSTILITLIIPSPGYRYLQVSRFISKSRRKRRGICPETGRCHSRRTRATSMVLTTTGTSRTHLRGILSVLGQP